MSQGVEGVLCGGEISENAKKILDDAGIWYEENVNPTNLKGQLRKERQSGNMTEFQMFSEGKKLSTIRMERNQGIFKTDIWGE